MKKISHLKKINVVYMPIYSTNHNSLSRTWIYAKNHKNYFQTEKNHQKNFQVNREREGDQPHPSMHVC